MARDGGMLCPHSHLGAWQRQPGACQERTKRNYSRMAPPCSVRRLADLRLTTRLCREHPRLWLELAPHLAVKDSGDVLLRVLRAGANRPPSLHPASTQSEWQINRTGKPLSWLAWELEAEPPAWAGESGSIGAKLSDTIT